MISIDDLSGGNATVNLNPIYSHLNVLDYNTSILSSRIDTLTMTAGGFDYTEQFSARSSLGLGYNISDTVSNISLSDVLKFNFGPDCVFDSCTFTSFGNMTLNDTVSACSFVTWTNVKLFGDVISCSFKTGSMLNIGGVNNVLSNGFDTARFVNITASDFLANTINDAFNWNINCNNLYSGRFIAGNLLNITASSASLFSANNVDTINLNCYALSSVSFNLESFIYAQGHMSNCLYQLDERVKIDGGNMESNTFSECTNVGISCESLFRCSIDNVSTFHVMCESIETCTFNDIKQMSFNVYSMRDNTFNTMYDAHITASLISNMVVTKMYSLCDISAFSIDWLQINWDPWASTYLTTGTVNVNACFVHGNIVGAEEAKVVCQSVKAVGVKNCKKATISAKSIASGFWVHDVDDLDLWLDNIDLPSADADIYGLSNIGTLHIHQHSSYNGSGWNYLNNRPMAAFSNGVKCLDFDFKVPTYLINNGATTWNGAGYGYPGYHISDIYVNGMPYTCYSH